MTRRGRDRRRALGGMFGDPTAAMGRPGPSDPVWTTRSRFIVGDFAAARTTSGPRLFQWGPEGLAGRLGGHRRSLHPGTEFFRSPSIFLREVGRYQPGRFAPVRFGQRSPRKLLAAVVADGIEMDARRVIESACISRQTIDGLQHSSSCPLGCHPAPSVASPGNRKPPFAGAFRMGPPGFEPGSHGL
jgi:hypothetical protein